MVNTLLYSLCRAISAALTVVLLLAVSGVRAQSDLLPAPIVNDEGGTVLITGTMVYTDPLFTAGVAQPVIILEDQAGFVDRNRGYLMPVESQVLGQIITDFYVSPVSYSMTLPIEPRGGFRDVDGDDVDDLGVQIFATAYWNNTFGDPFLEERDLYGGGWSGAYASTRISEDPALEWEIIGGTLIIWRRMISRAFRSDLARTACSLPRMTHVCAFPRAGRWSTSTANRSPSIARARSSLT